MPEIDSSTGAPELEFVSAKKIYDDQLISSSIIHELKQLNENLVLLRQTISNLKG